VQEKVKKIMIRI